MIIPEGYQMAPGESLVSPNQLRATPGYFEAMNIPLRRGRFFAASDTSASQPVVIIDERLARRFWPNGDPIGKRMYQPERPEDVVEPSEKTVWKTVVGVVGAVKQQGLIEGEGARVGAFYLPYAQNPSRSNGTRHSHVRRPGAADGVGEAGAHGDRSGVVVLRHPHDVGARRADRWISGERR